MTVKDKQADAENKESEGQEQQANADAENKESEGQEQQAGEDKSQEDSRTDELPEWAQASLTKARNEAARYRTERNELRSSVETLNAQLKDAKTQADIDAAVAEYQSQVDAEIKAERERAEKVAKALEDVGLPASVAEHIKGDTPEELATNAEKLKQMLGGSESRNLSGGFRPGIGGESRTVEDRVREIRSRRVI